MKRASYFLFFLLLFLFCKATFAQTYNGYVRSSQTNELLVRVDVVVNDKLETQTDSLGYFSFSTTNKGTSVDVAFHLYGYQSKTARLTTQEASVLLTPLSRELDEVTIVGYREKRGNNAFTYSASDVKKIITTIGEADVMRVMQVLPGISQGMEGGMSFYVRGGNNGNNRVELDGVPISAPSHLFGLFSTFHTDIVDKTVFQMGGISASSGDLLSSLMQMKTVNPSLNGFSGSASISPLMLGGSLQGFILKDKLSFQVAGRTSLLKAEFDLIKRLSKESIDGDFDPQVQDLYGKLHWKLNNKNSIHLMGYGSHDYFLFDAEEESNITSDEVAFGWDNRVAKIGWDYQINNFLKAETFTYYNHFNSWQRQLESLSGSKGGKQGMLLASEKDEWAIKSQLFYTKAKWNIMGGIDHRNQRFRPVVQKVFISKDDEVDTKHEYSTMLTTLFAESEYAKPSKYKLKGGIRYNLYATEGEVIHDFEARLFSSVFLTKNFGLEATYDQLSQFQHTLEGLPIGWALDLLVPASVKFKPEKSNQWYAGGFWGNRNFYVTVGGYYKTLSNLTSYKNLLNQLSTHNISWQEDVVQGKGKSYGLEVWLERRNSRWKGSIAYTLSKTVRRFDEINNGEVYPFKFDRPHNLSIQSQLQVVKKGCHQQYFNTSLYFTSGNTVTYPLASYQGDPLPYWSNVSIMEMEDYHARVRTEMSSKNDYRLPYYFRIDAGYSFLWEGKRTTNELTISAFNVLNRSNPYLIFHEDNTWKQLSVLPIVPSIRWEIRF